MEYIGIIVLIVSFLFLLIVGVPIAYSIGISGILTMLVSIDSLPAFATFAQRMATGLDSFALLAIPFFILAGNIMNSGGIAIRLINLARVLVGRLPASLAFVNVFANMLFGAISGSAAASASAIGAIMGPEMKKEGYDESFSASVNIASATTGLSIPPSNILIVYSLASGGASITALFLAGYIPGILTGFSIMITAMCISIYQNKGISAMFKTLFKVFIGVALILSVLYALNMLKAISPSGFKGVSTSLAVLVIGFIAYKLRNKKAGIKRGLNILWQAVPSLFLLIIVIGGIIAGFFTATEASAVAVLYALVLSLIYKEITVKDIPKIVLGSVKTTAIVLILVATCIGLSWIMAYENIPQNVSAGLLGLSDNPIVILLLINLILLVVGVFMDMTPAVL
ncbi:TRAP transporter large permease, partial [Ancylomarina sp. 16SWW S1-10-2]|uniref:TRAP transporter large permease n=2 Tax=Ancylomarina sp. 16SWW S1-10-2 TaxID=2499681 RepID=UPI0012AD916D